MKSFADYDALSKELSKETVDDLANLKLEAVNNPQFPSIKAHHHDRFFFTHVETDESMHEKLLAHFKKLYYELAFRVEQLAMEQFKGFYVDPEFATKVSNANVDIIRDILNGSAEYKDSLSPTPILNLVEESTVMIELQNVFMIFAGTTMAGADQSTIAVNIYVQRQERIENSPELFQVTKILSQTYV